MLASAPGTHKPARTTWSFLLIFLPPSSLFFYQQLFFQGTDRPQGAPHPHPSLRAQALVAFGYCSTEVPFFLFTDIQHISQKSRDGNLFYSQRSR